jgi:hypothetical protein
MAFAKSFKVEFLSSSLSADGSYQWIGNAYRYRTTEEAVQHFDYLRGIYASAIQSRVVATDDPINVAFENGKSSRVGEG